MKRELRDDNFGILRESKLFLPIVFEIKRETKEIVRILVLETKRVQKN